MLYIPADNEKFINNVLTLKLKEVTLDLEDSITPNNKQMARMMARKWLGNLSEFSRVYVRVNSIKTNLLEDDLDSVVRKGLSGITGTNTAAPKMRFAWLKPFRRVYRSPRVAF